MVCLCQIDRFSGDYSEGETPVPVPNTVVKAFSAHDTSRATSWESRTLPGFFLKKPVESGLNLFPQAFFVSDLAVCCSFDKMPLSVL